MELLEILICSLFIIFISLPMAIFCMSWESDEKLSILAMKMKGSFLYSSIGIYVVDSFSCPSKILVAGTGLFKQ
jgi:hypothetical protein